MTVLLSLWTSRSSTYCNAGPQQQEDLLTELTELYEQKELLLQNRARIEEKLNAIRRRQKHIESSLRELKKSTPIPNNMNTGESIRLENQVYTLQGQIGKGSFGLVRKACHPTTKDTLALKRCTIQHPSSVEIRREAQVLRYIQDKLGGHAHIVQLVGYST